MAEIHRRGGRTERMGPAESVFSGMAVTAALWRGLAGTGCNARPMFTSSDGVTSANQRDQIGTAGQASGR
jgi:hypothetical protein